MSFSVIFNVSVNFNTFLRYYHFPSSQLHSTRHRYQWFPMSLSFTCYHYSIQLFIAKVSSLLQSTFYCHHLSKLWPLITNSFIESSTWKNMDLSAMSYVKEQLQLKDCDINVSAFLFARLVFLWGQVDFLLTFLERELKKWVGSNKGGAENVKELILTMHTTGEE